MSQPDEHLAGERESGKAGMRCDAGSDSHFLAFPLSHFPDFASGYQTKSRLNVIFPALAICLAASGLLAREGVVQTRDGHFLDGHIRFESNLVIVANSAKDLLVFVDLTNLAELTFKQEPAVLRSEAAAVDGVLPAPWRGEDLGSARLAGAATCHSGLFRLRSWGTNIFGESDAFHFVYKPITGDSEIVARVLQVQSSAPWAKAGLMMRESLAADSRAVLLAMTPGRAGMFQWRETKGDATLGEEQRGMFVPSWIKLRREGDVFTAAKSRNGRQWSPAGRVVIPMGEAIFVGMAVAGVQETTPKRSWPRNAGAVFDNVREALFLENDSFIPIVQLQSGSRAVGRISQADERQIQFAGAPAPSPIPSFSVARILFRWLPDGLSKKLNSGRPGALLASGEFIEGDFKGIEKGQVKMSSVLMGLHSFDLNNELVAVVLRKPYLAPHDYEVKTLNGSVWMGTGLRIERDQVVLQERSLGVQRISVHEVLELKRTAP